MSTDDPTRVLQFPTVGLRPPIDGAPAEAGHESASAFPLFDIPRLTPPANAPTRHTAGAPAIVPPVSAAPAQRSQPGHREVAALSLVTLAAVSVAAMRGTYHVVRWAKARAEHHKAVAEKAKAEADKARAKAKGQVQPGPVFGQKTSKGGPSGMRSGGLGGGRSGGVKGGGHGGGKSGGGSRGSKGGRKAPDTFRSDAGPHKRSSGKHGGHGGGKNRGRKHGGAHGPSAGRSGAGTKHGKGKGAHGAHGGSGGAHGGRHGKKGGGLRHHNDGNRAGGRLRKNGHAGGGGNGKCRTTLGKAMQKEARRRLKQRRKNLDPPMLTRLPKGAGTKGQTKKNQNKGKPTPKGKGRTTLNKAIQKEARRRLKDRRQHLDAPIISRTQKNGTKGSGASKKKTTTGAGKKNRGKKTASAKWTQPHTIPTFWKDTREREERQRRTADERARWHRAGDRRREDAGHDTPGAGPRPGAGFDGRLRPPPGLFQPYTVTITREDPPAKTRTPRAALTSGTTPKGTSTVNPSPTPAPAPAPAAPQPGGNETADLTAHSLRDADYDAAEEILDRVADANAMVNSAEELQNRLEHLRAKVLSLHVPGLLLGYVERLMDQSGQIIAHAKGLADALPKASEAIRAAGDHVDAVHVPLADKVRDMGHQAPAEADYHKE